ncbi:hypothetical protein [Novosphingobium sp. SG720]|uniref:hypothetical protein n=1 Tax=Novosphingobium sp. SG720 TaxID=2586998 RepID=UPI0014458451|nr:hypothetical protein [Novosphingobium sp. SG720]NKJ43167.1 hypothetical protein [Novosphingobium sp. SG720]
MAEDIIKKVRVHYRRATWDGTDLPTESLQQILTSVLAGQLGNDARERIIPVTDDGQHKGCLNFSVPRSEALLADIMHLDGRSVLPTWIDPTEPKPVAKVIPRQLPVGERSLGEPAYILVRDNHVAAIERLGFRTTNLAVYLNGLMHKSGLVSANARCRLVPKIELQGSLKKGGGVKKIIVKPYAAVMGDGPTQSHEERRQRGRLRRAASRFEGLAVYGERIFGMLEAVGADQAKLEDLRAGMSSDLILKAKLELTVQSIRQKSTAEISSETVHEALAELALDGSVDIVDENGRNDGKLVQLVHKAEVAESGGLLEWDHAAAALKSAMLAWEAKKAIEL